MMFFEVYNSEDGHMVVISSKMAPSSILLLTTTRSGGSYRICSLFC